MASRGFLIRFIDIGLIVLFGFLMISDIEATSRVELAASQTESDSPAPQAEGRAFLVVEIEPAGTFRVVATGPEEIGPDAEIPGAGDLGRPDGEVAPEGTPAPDGAATPNVAGLPAEVRATSVGALAEILEARRRAHREAGLETVVLIQPHPASLVQATVDVMDVCDRLSLPKSLRMDIEIEAAPGEQGPDLP